MFWIKLISKVLDLVSKNIDVRFLRVTITFFGQVFGSWIPFERLHFYMGDFFC